MARTSTKQPEQKRSDPALESIKAKTTCGNCKSGFFFSRTVNGSLHRVCKLCNEVYNVESGEVVSPGRDLAGDVTDALDACTPMLKEELEALVWRHNPSYFAQRGNLMDEPTVTTQEASKTPENGEELSEIADLKPMGAKCKDCASIYCSKGLRSTYYCTAQEGPTPGMGRRIAYGDPACAAFRLRVGAMKEVKNYGEVRIG